MNEERPIVFTISQVGKLYTLTTKDSRAGTANPSSEVSANMLMVLMRDVSEMFNNAGYAVLFEVD